MGIFIACLQAVTVGSIAEKPVPFFLIGRHLGFFEARAPGYERASAKVERGGEGEGGRNRLLED